MNSVSSSKGTSPVEVSSNPTASICVESLSNAQIATRAKKTENSKKIFLFPNSLNIKDKGYSLEEFKNMKNHANKPSTLA